MADKKFLVTERELIEGALAAREGTGYISRDNTVNNNDYLVSWSQ